MSEENQRVGCLADAVRFMRQHHTLASEGRG